MSLHELTPALLHEHRWEYGAVEPPQPWGSMRFAPPAAPWAGGVARGRIYGFDHPNERRWILGDGALTLFDNHRNPTTRFDSFEVIDGRPTLRGPHLLHAGGAHNLHQLRTAVPLADWPVEAMSPLVTIEHLTDPARPLVVIFNSLGNPVGVDDAVRWEYYRFTQDAGIDFLRFAETDRPVTWYLRHETEVRHTLARAAAGRRRVIIAGNSSGGYAAIRFGHWLAEAGLAPEIRTISVNPQTAHSLPHRLHLWAREWDHFLPATIDDDVLRLANAGQTDLAPLLAAGRRHRFASISHTIFYDADNPAEAYYAGLIAGQPHVHLQPLQLGLSHKRGVSEMEHRGVMKTALRQAVDAPASWRSRVAISAGTIVPARLLRTVLRLQGQGSAPCQSGYLLEP